MINEYETRYHGELSYRDDDLFSVSMRGLEFVPRPANSKSNSEQSLKASLWKESTRKEIDRLIRLGKLRAIKGEQECILFITFYISKSRKRMDADNLLKPFLDGLNKESAREALWKKAPAGMDRSRKETWVKMRLNSCKYLIEDDSQFTTINTHKKWVAHAHEQGAAIQYFLAKTFKIIKVKEIKPDKDLNPGEEKILSTYFRKYWNYSMNFITAHEIVDGKEKGVEYKFIDNMPGRLFIVSKEDQNIGKIPPGYDWQEGEIVNECMVLKKTPAGEQDGIMQPPDFYYLTKWA